MTTDQKKYGMGWIPDYPDFRDYTEETEEVRALSQLIRCHTLKPPGFGPER
jgi:hypothetical protein